MATSYRERMLNNTKKEAETNNAISINTSYRQRALNANKQNNSLDNLWVESTAPNTLQKQNINATIKPVNIADFVKEVKNTAEQKQLKVEEDIAKAGYKSDDFTAEQKKQLSSGDYYINPSYNPDNKFSQKLIYKGNAGDIKVAPSLGQNVADIAEKTGRTVMDLTAATATGVARGYEGLADAAIGNVGNFASQVTSLGGRKPNNISESIRKGTENIVGYSLAGEMDKLAAEKRAEGEGAYNPNILGVNARDIVSEGARMVTLSPLGMAGFIGSAAGGNIEQALNEGENLSNAAFYGNITGGIEGATEKLFDTFNVIGGGKLDKFLPKNVIGKFVTGASGEGVEEMISQAVDPFIKMLTYEQDIENPFGSKENALNYLQDVGEAGLQGVVMGMFMQGMHDISSADVRNQYKSEVINAINKIKGLTNSQKQEMANGILEGASKYKFPTYKEIIEAQNQTQMPNVNQSNVITPNQAEMAQNANMEQIKRNTTINPQLQLLSTNSSALNGSINQNNDNVNEFGKQIDDLLSGKRNRKDSLVVLSNTPKIIQEIGAKDLPITVTSSKLERIMNAEGKQSKQYHDLGIDIVKQLPEALERPLNILKSHDNSYVVVTELADKQDRPIIASIKIDGAGRLNDVEILSNVMTSAYGRNNYDAYMQRNIKEGNLVYDIDEGIIKENLTDGARLQLSRTTNEVSNNSINQNDSSVNTEYAQNNKNDTTYISPVSDIQSATEFVKKATVNDIETLQKMVEEAEKNPDRIDLQFFAEKAREAIDKLSRQQVREAIIEETGLGDYNLDDVNKISKAKMNFTTPVRVIEKIFNKETANKINENFFKPIKHNEAERIRRLNQERNDIKELDVKPGSAEDAAIQKFGEGEYIDESGLTMPYTLENLKQDFPESWQKLQKATNVIRGKYDTYLEEINEVLKDNGYDPIPKRKDYFRHFEELNDLFSILGVPTKVDDIPTDLNGMTADLKPGKQFFANALQRKGNKTTYSAIKGIDGYLDGAMNILYHTKDIQKLRTLEKYIRDTYGAKKGLDDASAMTDEQKTKRINQINEGHLSEFAAWLMEYTNALAGKKSRLDRGIEEMFGRKAYKYLNLIKKQVGANMTGLNVNSALSNFISVTQAAPKTSKKALVKGTVDTVKNIFNNDGFIDKSDFLTTRFGSDKLAKNWWQKAGDVGQIFMSGTDYFTANLITRSKYQEFLDKGYTETEAMKKADEFADRLMAGRGKGDLPTAFESKMLGIVTQFQLEVTNQLDSIFYDTMHEDYASQSKSKLAKEHPDFYNGLSATFVLGQIFALAFLYNEGKEELTGAEGGALDPIGTIADAIKYYADENLSFTEATVKVVEDIANQLPFASIITGGGRLPIKEAFPDLLSVMRGESKLGDELWNLTNLLLPTGGGQVKKTTQGLKTFVEGGSYSKDAEGNKKLKYPVEQNLENFAKSALFGKWSTEGAKQYIDNGFKSLSANQTEGYEKAKKAGISDKQFYDAYNAQKKIKDLGDLTSLVKKNEIDKATKGLSQSKRKILYETFNVAKGEWDNSKIVYPYEIKAQKEKLAREKLKTKKK